MIRTFMDTGNDKIKSQLIAYVRERYGNEMAEVIDVQYDELQSQFSQTPAPDKFTMNMNKKENIRYSNRIKNYAVRNDLTYYAAISEMRKKGIIE